MSTTDYVRSLLDPFDQTFSNPKLYDGSVTRSSGLKFRQTGNVTLDATGADNYFFFFPGFGNGMCWGTAPAYSNTHGRYPTHLDSTVNRGNLRRVRLVSSAVKFTLLNSSDDNEGYWEAIRIPLESIQFADNTAPIAEDYSLLLSTAITGLSNYQTFQTGRLRDLHRFLFKLNSVAPDHPFKEVVSASAVPTLKDCYDENFDCILIRMVGRVDAVTPSMIQYDLVSNQEVVYKDNTVMARLATMNTMLPDLPVLLDRTRFVLPAIQLA